MYVYIWSVLYSMEIQEGVNGEAYPDLLCETVSTCAGGGSMGKAHSPWLRRFRDMKRENQERMNREL